MTIRRPWSSPCALAVSALVVILAVLAAQFPGGAGVRRPAVPQGLTATGGGLVRADEVWQAGRTGVGVTVAVVDTGVQEVADLAGRVVPVTNRSGVTMPCMNLSEERDCNDSYGHGTFVAGTVAGNGAASGGKWKGAAPGARIVSVKIAGRDGPPTSPTRSPGSSGWCPSRTPTTSACSTSRSAPTRPRPTPVTR